MCRGPGFARAAHTMSLSLRREILYGPVRSRRLGRSLGINLLPSGMKVCNMNCAYCQYGWTRGAARYRGDTSSWPSIEAVGVALEDRLSRATIEDELIDRLTVAGHGEPTLHPEFEAVSLRIRGVRDRLAPGIPIAILSNSTTAAWEDVRRGLALYDERHMKLDAGDPITYARINGSAGPGRAIHDVVESLRLLPPVIVHAMFVTDAPGEIDNSGERPVAEWLSALDRLHVARVDLYTLAARAPALSTLRPVGRGRLREIAEQVRALGLLADVISAPTHPEASRSDRRARSGSPGNRRPPSPAR